MGESKMPPKKKLKPEKNQCTLGISHAKFELHHAAAPSANGDVVARRNGEGEAVEHQRARERVAQAYVAQIDRSSWRIACR